MMHATNLPSTAPWTALLCLGVSLLTISTYGCSGRDLRGWQEASTDGKTYLVIEDDNAGTCKFILLDGAPFRHAVREKGEVSPGRHVLKCNHSGEYEFKIRPGHTFHFDYWGP